MPVLRSRATGSNPLAVAEHDPVPVCARATATHYRSVTVLNDFAGGGIQDIYASFGHDIAPWPCIFMVIPE